MARGKIKITPKFSHKQVEMKIRNFWFTIQNEAFKTAAIVSAAMISHLNNNTNRAGSGRNLAGYLYPDIISTTGEIYWGIGKISELNTHCEYWYVLNYGRKVSGERFRPGGGKYTPYQFSDGKADPNQKGTGAGTGRALYFRKSTTRTSYINPINYIEQGQKVLGKEIARIVAMARTYMKAGK